MKASELIEELQKLIKKYGDREVATDDDGGMYGHFYVGGVTIDFDTNTDYDEDDDDEPKEEIIFVIG